MFSDYWSFDPEFNNFGATNLNRFIDLAPSRRPGNLERGHRGDHAQSHI
jgi:hypothetical protein